MVTRGAASETSKPLEPAPLILTARRADQRRERQTAIAVDTPQPNRRTVVTRPLFLRPGAPLSTRMQTADERHRCHSAENA